MWKQLCALMLAGAAGCGGTVGEGNTLEMPNLGLTMRGPEGWRVSADEPWFCYDPTNRDENSCRIDHDDLQGASLEEYVSKMTGITPDTALPNPPPDQPLRPLDTRYWRMVITTTQDDHKAIEVLSEGVNMMSEFFVKHGNRVIRVSFVTTPEKHPTLEAAFRKSFESIRLK